MSIDVANWAVSIVSALTAGIILFLMASGLSLVFGVLRILNFSHASFMMIGAYITSELAGTSSSTWLFLAALVLAPVAVAAVGTLIEVALLRRVYDRPHLTQLLVTFSMVFILWGVVEEIWGAQSRRVAVPDALATSVELLGRPVPAYYVAPWLVAVVVTAGLWWVMKKSRLGREMRASAYDREVASLAGIDSGRLFTKVFALGSWLAGVAGVLLAPMQVLTPTMDQGIILQAFIVVVIGGLGSVAGSMAGAMALGLSNGIAVQLLPRLALGLPFIVMAIVLIARPQGLFGRKDRVV